MQCSNDNDITIWSGGVTCSVALIHNAMTWWCDIQNSTDNVIAV